MTVSAEGDENGLAVAFADGCHGIIPFADIPEVGTLENLKSLDMPNAYELVLEARNGDVIELPWDFARSYCEAAYPDRVRQVAQRGRQAIGERIRRQRLTARLTQQDAADAAGLNRVTLVRIENGDESPRYDTLIRLAQALRVEPAALLAPED